MKLKHEFCRDFFSEKLYFPEEEDNLYEEIDKWCQEGLSTNDLSDNTYEYIREAYLGMLKQREFDTVRVYRQQTSFAEVHEVSPSFISFPPTLDYMNALKRQESYHQGYNFASFTPAPSTNPSFIFSTLAPTTPLNYINNRVKGKSKNHSSIKTSRLNFSRVIKFIPSDKDTKGWENFISDLDKIGTKMWSSIENKIKEGGNYPADVKKVKNLKAAGKIILDLARNNTAANPAGGKKKALKYCLAYYNFFVREGMAFQEKLMETKYVNCTKGNFTQISFSQLPEASPQNQKYLPPPKSIGSQFIGGALIGAIVGALFVWLFFVLLPTKRSGNEKNKPLPNISRLEAQVNSKEYVKFTSNV